MSSVLYDAPGPRAKRRNLIGTIIVAAILVGLVIAAVMRLSNNGQFTADKWNPLINPSDENFSQVWQLLGKGLLATLRAGLIAAFLSLVLGSVIAVTRMMANRAGRFLLVPVVELLRGLPVVVTIYLTWRFFVESKIDISWLPGDVGMWYLVIAVTIYHMVVVSEIVRSGVAALPRGQREASAAIGMSGLQTMKVVLLPQAFRIMLPALISEFVVVIKDTSLAAFAGIYIELLRQGSLIKENLHNPLQVYFVVGAIYILVNYTISRLAVYAERRLSRGKKTGDAQPLAPALVPGAPLEPGPGGGGVTV